MKTTSEKLIAEAEKLEAQARALRVAAGVMNGHETARKQAGAETTIAQAVKLRRTHKSNGAAPDAPTPPEGVDINSLSDAAYNYRQQLVRQFLHDGPKAAPEIRAHLTAHGITKTQNVTGMMRKMRDVRLKGFARGARWSLRETRS